MMLTFSTLKDIDNTSLLHANFNMSRTLAGLLRLKKVYGTKSIHKDNTWSNSVRTPAFKGYSKREYNYKTEHMERMSFESTNIY